MKLSEYVDLTHEYLKENGWVSQQTGPGKSCCVLVASGRALGRYVNQRAEHNQLASAIIELFNAYAQAEEGKYIGIVEWNDNPFRTWEEVDLMFRRLSGTLKAVGQ